MKSAQEEWKHDIVYDPESQNDIYFCTDLLYDGNVAIQKKDFYSDVQTISNWI